MLCGVAQSSSILSGCRPILWNVWMTRLYTVSMLASDLYRRLNELPHLNDVLDTVDFFCQVSVGRRGTEYDFWEQKESLNHREKH